MILRVGLEYPGNNPISRKIASIGEPKLFSHAGFWLGDDWMYEAHWTGGTRWRRYTPDRRQWVFFAVPLTFSESARLEDWMKTHAGDPYDLCGALATTAKLLFRQNPGAWFCSEAVVAAMQSIDGTYYQGVEASTVRPNDLYGMMMEDPRFVFEDGVRDA